MSAQYGKRRSLLARAIVALLLTVGFYTLALLFVAGLGLAIYVDAQDGRISGFAFFAVIGIGSILFGIFPRPQPFIRPGPRVTAEEQPHLFREIRRVADATGSSMPDEVYIAPGPSASVAMSVASPAPGGRVR